MKQRIRIILTLTLLAAFGAGCGVEHKVYLEQETSASECAGVDARQSDTQVDEPDQAEQKADMTEQTTDTAEEREHQGAVAAERCYVYVCGAVRVPGVYVLKPGSRIYEAVALAGGMTEEAGTSAVNQAQAVCDGLMIYIPTEEEISSADGEWSAADGQASGSAEPEKRAESADGRLDLNAASVTELMDLPGIGQTKAESILAYREKCGGFSSVEEIMKVDGIKEGLYNRIKDDIKVK